MALKNNWKKLQDAIPGMENSGDEISVVPINRIADAVIELEEHAEGTQEKLSSEQINNIDKIPDISRTASDAQNVAYSAHNVASTTYPIAISAKELAEFAENAAAGAYSQSTTALKGVDACYQAIGRAESLAIEAKAVALGRATGYVFDTYADMNEWLTVQANVIKLVSGDNLYIRDTEVPDYWWDGENPQPLETQKVDLTEYPQKSDFKTVNGESILGDGDIEIQGGSISSGEYELITKVIVGYSVLKTKPSDWESNYAMYYKNIGTEKEPIYTIINNVDEWNEGDCYSYSSEESTISLTTDVSLDGIVIDAQFKPATAKRNLQIDLRDYTGGSATVNKLAAIAVSNGISTEAINFVGCYENFNGCVWKGFHNSDGTIGTYIGYVPREKPCNRIQFKSAIPAGSTITIYGVIAK